MAATAPKTITKTNTILKDGGVYRIFGDVGIIDSLPNKVLEVKTSMFGLYLEEATPIRLPKKIYSNDKIFIEHVMKSYSAAEGSLGILLSGAKGLGKSFTANVICDKLKLPVIRISQKLPNATELFSFLNKIEQEHIIFIDEFEKIFSVSRTASFGSSKTDEDHMSQTDFLSFLDNGSIGVKRMFIITANESVSEYLMNRPTRIRYHRQYRHMAIDVIKEIVDDLLVNKEFKQDLIESVPQKDVNIDVLIKIIQEVNLHNIPYSAFKDFFNFQTGSFEAVEVLRENGTIALKEANIRFPLSEGMNIFYDPKTEEDVDVVDVLSETAAQAVVNTQTRNPEYVSKKDTPDEDEYINEVYILKRKFNVLY